MTLSTLFVLAQALFSVAAPQSLPSEFTRLEALVRALAPEYQVGGYLNGKQFGDHEILWKLAEKSGEMDTIRIYREKGPDQEPFAVTYYRASHIVPGRTVLRRFWGPAFTGWRNDTVDFYTGEHLGSQGSQQPTIDARDQQILSQWRIATP